MSSSAARVWCESPRCRSRVSASETRAATTGDAPSALAAIAASAADGMRRKAAPPDPIEGDAYAQPELPALPGSLESALAAFGEDEALVRALGIGFCDYYVKSRACELKAWRETVTDWERERYDRSV